MKMPATLKLTFIATGLTVAVLITACGDGFRTLPIKPGDGKVDFEGSKTTQTINPDGKKEAPPTPPVTIPNPEVKTPTTESQTPPVVAPTTETEAGTATPPTPAVTTETKPLKPDVPKPPVTVETKTTTENAEGKVAKDVKLIVTFKKATKMSQVNHEYESLTILNELLVNNELYSFVAFPGDNFPSALSLLPHTPLPHTAPTVKEGLRLKYISQCRDTDGKASKTTCENYYLVLSFYKVEITKKAIKEDDVDQEKETLIDQFGILQSNIFDKVVIEKLEILVDQHSQQYDIMDNLRKVWRAKYIELADEARRNDPVQQRMEDTSPFVHGA